MKKINKRLIWKIINILSISSCFIIPTITLSYMAMDRYDLITKIPDVYDDASMKAWALTNGFKVKDNEITVNKKFIITIDYLASPEIKAINKEKLDLLNASVLPTKRFNELPTMDQGALIGLSFVSLGVLIIYVKLVYMPYLARRNHAEILKATQENNSHSNISDELLVKTVRIKALEVKVKNKDITDKELKELERLLK